MLAFSSYVLPSAGIHGAAALSPLVVLSVSLSFFSLPSSLPPPHPPSFPAAPAVRRRPHRVVPEKKDDGPIRKDERNAHADAFDPQFSLHHSPLETQIHQEML